MWAGLTEEMKHEWGTAAKARNEVRYISEMRLAILRRERKEMTICPEETYSFARMMLASLRV